MDNRIVAIDIGGGTQDIFLYEPGKSVENCIQLILPSPTVTIGEEIHRATEQGKDIFLHGQLMGGGANSSALGHHLEKGLKAYATPDAAKTFHDNLERVKKLGVIITEDAPPAAVPIKTADLDLDRLGKALELYGVSLPTRVAVAVQDHGESPNSSNREFRIKHWAQFIEQGGLLSNLIYQDIPSYFTRMQAVQKEQPGAYLMDTGSAAIWGALCDPYVIPYRERGLIVVNIGNQHTVGVLVKGDRVLGLFEHHTGLMTKEKLADYVERLRLGELTHQEIFNDRGHGCYIHSTYHYSEGDFQAVVVTGPNRNLVKDLGYHFAVPFGDMMLSGCFGLVAAIKNDVNI